MAFLKSFTDLSGVTHETSCWRAVTINTAPLEERIYLTFYGYANPQAAAEKLQPLSGAVRNYIVEGQAFWDIAMGIPVAGITRYNDQAQQCESFALSVLDTPTSDKDATLVSFFHGATQV